MFRILRMVRSGHTVRRATVGFAGAVLCLIIQACEAIDGLEPPLNHPPAQATTPVPADEATGVEIAPMLRWSGGLDPDGDTVVFEIYLGGAEPLQLAGTGSERAFQVPERLAPETVIFWRVVTRDLLGAAVESDTWTFRTLEFPNDNEPPGTPENPNPVDGANAVPRLSNLAWSGGADPDLDIVTFDIHFGTESPPPYATSQAGVGYDPPQDLAYEARYYWQVIARDDHGGVSAGPIWTFLTELRPNAPPAPPQDPDPEDHATGVASDAVLGWSGGADPDLDVVTFDIHFGVSNPPPYAATQAGASYDPPGDLDYESGYFWQVVARDDRGGTMAGPIWSFSTGPRPNEPPSTPSGPDPENGATGVEIDVPLHWEGGADPDGDPPSFHVYFGTDDPPPFAAIVTDQSFDPVGTFDPLTIYYWRIVAVDGDGGETSGGTWMFTTGP